MILVPCPNVSFSSAMTEHGHIQRFFQLFESCLGKDCHIMFKSFFNYIYLIQRKKSEQETWTWKTEEIAHSEKLQNITKRTEQEFIFIFHFSLSKNLSPELSMKGRFQIYHKLCFTFILRIIVNLLFQQTLSNWPISPI